MFYAESSENRGDIGFLTETDTGIFAVDFDSEELACRAEVHDHIFLWEFPFDFDRGFGSGLWVRHEDIIDFLPSWLFSSDLVEGFP
jgi:hypothetical protein